LEDDLQKWGPLEGPDKFLRMEVAAERLERDIISINCAPSEPQATIPETRASPIGFDLPHQKRVKQSQS
jgi:hypothetical protein